MLNTLVTLLKEADVTAWEISDVRTRGWEFYFIRHDLDQNRVKDMEHITLKVYQSIEDGAFLGSASCEIAPSADEAELPTLTRAAEAYGKEHPALTIHVSQTTARDFGRDYLLDGRRDLFLAPNRFTQEQIIGWYVTDSQWLVVFARRPHFAVASGDPKGIGSVKNLLSKLRANTAVLGYVKGLSTEQSYGESVLQFLGCTYSEVKALPSQYFETNAEIAAAIAEGTVDAGVFWGAEVKQYGLTALPDVPYALDTGAPQDSYAVLPVSSRGHEQAVAFAQWMADHPELFDEAQ